MSGNTPLRFLGVGYMLDREYRNSPAYQWGRELARNGIEANAKNIQFGVEWQGVEATGTYRLQYADDGHGMTRDQLREYMVTLGKGSKAVGGPHDNYALGSRMTLLPWNSEGVVVVSVVDGDANMVKMKFDVDASDGEGAYVLEEVAWEDEDGTEGMATVYPPYFDDDLGVDWAAAIPDFITEAGHGTTFILLGRGPNDDTLNGDPDRNELLQFLTRKYFNIRFWDLPEGVTLRCLDLVKARDRAMWPKSRDDRQGKYQFRTVKGAKSIAEYVTRDGESTLDSSGTVALADGTKAHWYLRKDASVDTGGVGSASGFISVLYRGELYGHAYANQDDGDTRVGANVYRQFGIGSDVVRKRVFIVLEPPEFNEVTGAPGVAPSTGRADLYWMGAGLSPRSVKPADWSEDFSYHMPPQIQAAIDAAHDESRQTSEEREERMRRVMDRFKKRWRAPRARTTDEGADTTTKPASPGTAPRAPIDSPTQTRRPRKKVKRVQIRGRSGASTIGTPATGTAPAKSTMVAVGLPDCRFVTAEDINDPGMIAAWQQPSKQFPNGVIEIDRTHPVIRGQIEYWQLQYPPAVAKTVEDIVLEVYADVAVAKVSHLYALTGAVLSEEQRNEMLLNPALSTSMLGLISEDALIAPRTGKLGMKRRKAEEEADQSEALAPDEASTPAA